MTSEVIMAIVSVAVGFIACFIWGWKLKGRDPLLERTLDLIVSNYLDERRFTLRDLEKHGLTRDAAKTALRKLERAGLLMKMDGESYRIRDPLVFLTDRDYERAIRITKDDNILYGAYQNPYLPRLYLLLIYGIFVADLVFVLLAYLSQTIGWPSPAISQWVINILPGHDESLLLPFLLFLLGMGLIFVDFLDNVIKAWARERYSVVVGALSGISYDVSLADELSGRIRRGEIEDVDLDLSLLQKLMNYFKSVPVGDVVVKVRGKKEPIRFRNMPFPRELFYVIRSVQLGALQWRKKHAKTLMLWRAKSVSPVVPRS